MNPQQILFCTSNASKQLVFSRELEKASVKMLTLEDAGLGQLTISEEGSTFSEIAVNKFNQYALHIEDKNLAFFTDDSGLSIDALDGEPGIKSRRWKDGKTAMSDMEFIAYLQERMKDIPLGQRTARLQFSMAYGRAGEEPRLVFGEMRGVLLKEPKMLYMAPGFPFRPFFYIESENQMYSTLEADPNWHGPREDAVNKMLTDLGIIQSQ